MMVEEQHDTELKCECVRKVFEPEEVCVSCGRLEIVLTPNNNLIKVDGVELQRVTKFSLLKDFTGADLIRFNVEMLVDPRL